MKIWFTDDTRPSMCSGTRSCSSVERTSTLTMSSAPLAASSSSDSANERDSANPIMARPKPATASNSVRPAWGRGGRTASSRRRDQRPHGGRRAQQAEALGPTCRISSANTGSSATAPPNSTANRSRVMAASSTRSPSRKRTPSPTLAKQRRRRGRGVPRGPRPHRRSMVTSASSSKRDGGQVGAARRPTQP